MRRFLNYMGRFLEVSCSRDAEDEVRGRERGRRMKRVGDVRDEVMLGQVR